MHTVALLGFLRLYASPGEPAFPTVVLLQNPHVARSVLAIDDTPLGEVAPLARVTVRGLPAGVHAVRWTTPSGFVRASSVTTAPSPAR